MAWGIVIYKSLDRYVPFIMADDIYDRMKESLSTEKGINMYGMEFINGRKGISDEKIDSIDDKLNSLIERLNAGEKLSLDKELDKIIL